MATTKIQYGRGLSDLVFVGMKLSMLIAKTKDLQSPIEQALMMHNLHESFPLNKDQKQKAFIKDNHKRIKLLLSPEINGLNKEIVKINKTLKGLDFNIKIPKLVVSDILNIVDRRMNTVLEVENAQMMGNDLFRKQLSDLLYKPTEAILNFIKKTTEEEFTEKVKSIAQPYQAGIRQSLDVCSIGYYTTAVFIAGRTIEELVNDYFDVLFRSKKVEKFDLKSLKLENKIGKLNKEGYIDELTYHSLSGIRIDRNEMGHPGSRLLSKDQAHLKIQVIISEIPKIEKRIEKIKSSLKR